MNSALLDLLHFPDLSCDFDEINFVNLIQSFAIYENDVIKGTRRVKKGKSWNRYVIVSNHLLPLTTSFRKVMLSKSQGGSRKATLEI